MIRLPWWLRRCNCRSFFARNGWHADGCPRYRRVDRSYLFRAPNIPPPEAPPASSWHSRRRPLPPDSLADADDGPWLEMVRKLVAEARKDGRKVRASIEKMARKVPPEPGDLILRAVHSGGWRIEIRIGDWPTCETGLCRCRDCRDREGS